MSAGPASGVGFVQPFRDDFLARSALAGQQDRGVESGDLAKARDQLRHGAGPDEHPALVRWRGFTHVSPVGFRPDAGTALAAGEEFGEVESVKAVSPLYSPVDGEITEVNSDLADNLERLSEDPYENGWIIRVRIDDESSHAKLMDYAAYQKQCAEEG